MNAVNKAVVCILLIAGLIAAPPVCTAISDRPEWNWEGACTPAVAFGLGGSDPAETCQTVNETGQWSAAIGATSLENTFLAFSVLLQGDSYLEIGLYSASRQYVKLLVLENGKKYSNGSQIGYFCENEWLYISLSVGTESDGRLWMNGIEIPLSTNEAMAEPDILCLSVICNADGLAAVSSLKQKTDGGAENPLSVSPLPETKTAVEEEKSILYLPKDAENREWETIWEYIIPSRPASVSMFRDGSLSQITKKIVDGSVLLVRDNDMYRYYTILLREAATVKQIVCRQAGTVLNNSFSTGELEVDAELVPGTGHAILVAALYAHERLLSMEMTKLSVNYHLRFRTEISRECTEIKILLLNDLYYLQPLARAVILSGGSA